MNREELLKLLRHMVDTSPRDDANGICLHCGRDNEGFAGLSCSNDCPHQQIVDLLEGIPA